MKRVLGRIFLLSLGGGIWSIPAERFLSRFRVLHLPGLCLALAGTEVPVLYVLGDLGAIVWLWPSTVVALLLGFATGCASIEAFVLPRLLAVLMPLYLHARTHAERPPSTDAHLRERAVSLNADIVPERLERLPEFDRL